MSKETKNTNEVQDASTPVQRVRNDWKALVEKLSYKAIVNNVPFLAFVALLCVLYIGANKRAVDTQRELNKLNDTLKELRWEYMDAKSQMMYAQMETEVIRNASKIDLKPMLMPAFKIKRDTTTITQTH
ncbi:MAG: hypothetical protein KDC07_05390 [Chitinophagaceae bacterium]|nr:hypothetical protein [Chitinophagaceae bacterium]MCB9045299.1 hypothetical protein [Chitinophagales bacterium]